MKMIKIAALYSVAILLAGQWALADIPAPAPPVQQQTPTAAVPAREASLYLSLSSGVDEPTLVIERSTLEKLNAAAAIKGSANAAPGAAGGPTIHTFAGGAFLSLAFVFGGLWLVRSKFVLPRSVLGALAIAMFGTAATIAIGNVPPPPRVALSSAIFDAKLMSDATARGKVRIMIVDYDSDDDIGLLIPEKKRAAGK